MRFSNPVSRPPVRSVACESVASYRCHHPFEVGYGPVFEGSRRASEPAPGRSVPSVRRSLRVA